MLQLIVQKAELCGSVPSDHGPPLRPFLFYAQSNFDSGQQSNEPVSVKEESWTPYIHSRSTESSNFQEVSTWFKRNAYELFGDHRASFTGNIIIQNTVHLN